MKDIDSPPHFLNQPPGSLGRWIYVVACIGVLWLVFEMSRPIFSAIFFGILGTIIAAPLFERLSRRLRPSIASFITCVILFICLIAPLLSLVHYIVVQIAELAQATVDPSQMSSHSIFQTLQNRYELLPFASDLVPFSTLFVYFKQILSMVGQFSLSVLKSIPDLALQATIAGLCTYFFLADRDFFRQKVLGQIPIRSDALATLLQSFSNTIETMLIANLWAGLAQAILVTLSFLFLDVPHAVLAGSLTFILAWTPLVGSAPIWGLASIYLATEGLWLKFGLMIGIGIVITTSDNIVRPLILKGRNEMHPLVSLLAMICGAGYMGLTGLFIGPALIAVAVTLIELWPKVLETSHEVPSKQGPLSH